MSAPGYRPHLQIEVSHAFHADGRCPGLRWTPSPRTGAIVDRLGAIVRATPDGLLMLAPDEGPHLSFDEIDDDAALVWLLHCDRHAFANRTADACRVREEIMIFDAAGDRAGPPADDADPDTPTAGASRLHALDAAGARECHPLACAQALDASLAPLLRDGAIGLVRVPLACLQFGAHPGDPAADAPARFRIRFAARATRWRYCLVGDWTEPSLQVVDLDERTTFVAGPDRRLADGRSALTFLSTDPIALREHPCERFQLSSRGAAPIERTRANKVVVKRLPAAAPRHFSREVIDSALALVSDIFVHR